MENASKVLHPCRNILPRAERFRICFNMLQILHKCSTNASELLKMRQKRVKNASKMLQQCGPTIYI